MGFLKKLFGGEKKKRTLLDEVEETGGKLIVNGYRALAAQNDCAPTSKTTDKEILAIYKQVGTAFREVSSEREEFIPAGTLNYIVWKFLQMKEMFGAEMLYEHLKYEVNKYREEGLRDDYNQELNLF